MSQQNESLEDFFPKGAIAFFGLVVLIMAFVWFGAYFLMIYRH